LQTMRDNPDWQDLQRDTLLPQTIKAWEYLLSLSEDQVQVAFLGQFHQKSRRQPAYWDDPIYSNPSQPVVGVTWFEANAYCTWLATVGGKPFRLPSEVEWEAAARKFLDHDGQIYPWGSDWDQGKANTIEGRLLKPSPVGVYAGSGGVGPFEIEDQSGNVYEWTSSLYLPYPYDPENSEQPEADGKRVLRGGSWGYVRRFARCASRTGLSPSYYLTSVGFRVLSPGINQGSFS
jgi:formylglycine-generating enzyme required for sulfatase activity